MLPSYSKTKWNSSRIRVSCNTHKMIPPRNISSDHDSPSKIGKLIFILVEMNIMTTSDNLGTIIENL